MGEAKRRRRHLEALVSAPVPEAGLFLISRQAGVTVALAAKPAEAGKVDAALFCVDEWQEGLFQCLGRRFEPANLFQQELARNGGAFRPSDTEECGLCVMWGREIRKKAQAPVPKGFESWKFLLPRLEETVAVEIAYSCPECGVSLPAKLQATILDSVGKAVTCYFPCAECIRTKRRELSAEAAGFAHRDRMEEFLEADGFSLRPGKDLP